MTGCKHNGLVAASKPKTASKTYPLNYKPASTGALQEGQVTFYDKIGGSGSGLLENMRNHYPIIILRRRDAPQ